MIIRLKLSYNMKMKRIAFVNHRYGKEVTGGSELLCGILAKKMAEMYEVDILTTCAIDDATWANYYPPGYSEEEGIGIHRFQTSKTRDWASWGELEHMIGKEHSYENEVQWIESQGPYSPELFEYVHSNYCKYDAIVFMTYIYYTTAVCMLGIPNALLLPTAHDEPAIYLEHYKKVFTQHKGFIFNTPEEKELVDRLFETGGIPYEICGMGIDIPNDYMINDFRQKFNLKSRYLLYAGRITEGKGCGTLFSYFARYKKENEIDLDLVLIGNKAMEIPCRDDVKYLGFVSENEKYTLMANSEALAIASHFESLSIVALETMALKRPILVSGKCPVLKGHCIRSEAGLYFESYKEFSDCVDKILYEHLHENKLGEKARKYIQENYTWDIIVKRLVRLIENVDYQCVDKCFYRTEYELCGKVEPIKEDEVTVVFAADDKYAPILSVALQSVVSTSSENNYYDIIVLSDGISLRNRKTLLQQCLRKNISLRFLEVGYLLDKYTFDFNNQQLSRATFMRLLMPDVMKGFTVVLYLDGDVVVKRDIAEILRTDMKGYCIGGIEDPHIWAVRQYRENISAHLNKNLGIQTQDKYFNAGVLIFNLKEITKACTTKDMLDMAASRKWMWEDQDVLNKLFKGKVKWIEANWNVLWVPDTTIQEIMMMNNEYTRAFYNPYLIHYAAGAMPIKRLSDYYAAEFWREAKESPYYEELVNSMPMQMQEQQVVLPIVQEQKIFKNPFERKLYSAKMYIRSEGLGYVMKTLWYNIQAYVRYGFHDDAAISEYVERKRWNIK